MKEVNICKRFTDAVGIVAAVFAFSVFFTANEAFKPTDELEHFWQDPVTMAYIKIFAAFLFSTLVNAVTRRQPTIGPLAAYVPLYFVFEAFTTEKLTQHPIAYILLALIHLAGGLIYLFQWVASEDRPVLNSRRAAVTAISVSLVWLVVWLLAHFKFSMKIRLMLTPAFWCMTGYGLLCGILAFAWYLKARKTEDSAADGRLWLSLSSICICFIVIILRILLSNFGY